MKSLTPVDQAERRLKLPRGWLRVQAAGGRIPHLRADDQIWVHLPTVRRILAAVAKGPPPAPAMSEGARRIAAERARHPRLGWIKEHDLDEHQHGKLAEVAAELATHTTTPGVWLDRFERDPFDLIAKHGEDPIRCLEVAGALIAAEIDRRLEDQS